MTNKDQIKTIASEFKWDDRKLIDKIADEQMPDFAPRIEFKEKLDTKIQEKIRLTKEQKADQEAINAVPSRLKWRFYLTWYGYAIVSFLALFLIWFCTNIFTWKLAIPTKYTYLEESKAFGNIENWELVYNNDVNIASNLFYDTNVDYEEDMIEYEESIDNSTKSWKSIQTLWATMSATEKFLDSSDTWTEDIFTSDYLLNRNFMFNQTYRFAYKSKKFPKLAAEYPIYKVSWILMWSNTPNQVLKNLKIWDVSFKNFQDLEIVGLNVEQNIENWYSISFDGYNKELNFYHNNTRQAQEFDGKLPSKKQIIKAVEKDLKQIWISIKNYWDGEADIDNYDESIWTVNVFYPFKIWWKEVWNREMEERIWMNITYDLNQQKVISVIWIDIATYDVSNYPTLEKSSIENWIEKWWEFFNQWALHQNSTVVLFDNMEIVYIPKYENWVTYYVPAIKWEVGTSPENYRWPKYVFQEIVE